MQKLPVVQYFGSPISSAWLQAFQDNNLIYKANAMEAGHTKDMRARMHMCIVMEFLKHWVFWLTPGNGLL